MQIPPDDQGASEWQFGFMVVERRLGRAREA